MKKLTFMLLLATAGSSLASTISWTLKGQSFGTSDGSNTRAAGYYTTVIMASDLEAAKTAIDNFSDGISDFEKLVKSSGTTAKSGATSGEFTSAKDDGETEDFYIISFDAGTLADAENYIVSGMITGTTYGGMTAVKTEVNSDNFASSSWAEVGTASQNPDPGPGPGPGPQPGVPEPSVAVLGLVGAGLLFKRRK